MTKLKVEEFEYKTLEDLDFVNPNVVEVSGRRFSFPKKSEVLKRILRSIGIPSITFENQLYRINESVWKNLMRSEIENSVSQEFLKALKFVIREGEIVGLCGSENTIGDLYNRVIEIANELNAVVTLDDYSDSVVRFIISSAVSSSGILVTYYLTGDWLDVRSIYRSGDVRYSLVDRAVSMQVENSSFNDILDVDILKTYFCEEILKIRTEDLINKCSKSDLSISEVKSLLKRDFGIKYKDQVDVFDFAANHPEFNSFAVSKLADVIQRLNSSSKIALYAPWLKTAVTFTSPASTYLELLSALVESDSKYWDILSNFIALVQSPNLNETQLMFDVDVDAGNEEDCVNED